MKKIYLLPLLAVMLASCHGNSIIGGPMSDLGDQSSSSSVVAQTGKSRELLTINSILVPAVELDPSARNKIPAGLDVDSALSDAIHEELMLKVSYEEKSGKQHPDPNEYLAKAKKQGLDGVLITKITHFVSRQGSAIGSSRPAEVDFIMILVRVSDGKTVWNSNFHYKDQALTDNLLLIKQKFSGEDGPTFKSADELLSAGYSQSLADLAKRRLEQFSAR